MPGVLFPAMMRSDSTTAAIRFTRGLYRDTAGAFSAKVQPITEVKISIKNILVALDRIQDLTGALYDGEQWIFSNIYRKIHLQAHALIEAL